MKFEIKQVRFDQVGNKQFQVYVCGDRKQQAGGFKYGLLCWDLGCDKWALITGQQFSDGNLETSYRSYSDDFNEATEEITNELLGSTWIGGES